jgi:hypothetical protein
MSAVFETVKGWEVGQLAALVYKIGEENARRILTCKKVTVTFNEEEQIACVVGKPWQIWKTIKLGTGIKDGVGFCTEIGKIGGRVGDWARDILSQKAFTVATTEEEIDLVVVSVAELGFKEGARYDTICSRAVELGLELCPAEVGPQLWLQYQEQPLNEWIIVAMEAIRASHGRLRVFGVGHDDDGQWLHSYWGSRGSFWGAVDRFVFRACK